jgi:hypothetical protein
VITPDAIIAAFEAETHLAPRVHERLARLTDLGLIASEYLEATQELEQRFGKFEILVWDVEIDPRRWSETSELDAADGTYWQESFPERRPGGILWVARKQYGQNVELRWWTPNRRLDARWQELDRILSSVV